jgi:hypothetical protein
MLLLLLMLMLLLLSLFSRSLAVGASNVPLFLIYPRGTLLCRTNKSVESQLVRREVAKMFPSPGPGRYTNGIAVDKLGGCTF